MAVALALFSAFPASAALAGPATDALSTCLVRAVSDEDRVVLMQWIFSTMARHPGVAQLSNISPEQRIEINRKGGALFTRLLTADCTLETRKAVLDDGQTALSSAFNVLGGTAMDGLMADPAVQVSLGDLADYIDQNRLKAVFGVPNQKPAATPAAVSDGKPAEKPKTVPVAEVKPAETRTVSAPAAASK
ncbi:hypothetical protein [Asticcacaulis solisilvae]|uniref:hypothetical protein n=1 Tax=Asticcacaulis solisilvae TaxID=1217274 RepID=UPI003FD82862